MSHSSDQRKNSEHILINTIFQTQILTAPNNQTPENFSSNKLKIL